MIYLVDGSHLLHRVRHTPQAELTTTDGRPSGLVHGFIRSLARISRLSGHNSKFIVCWDKSSSSFRQSIVPGYKEDRHTEVTDEDRKHLQLYNEGRSLIMNILGLFRIPTIQIHGIEADDIIAFCSRIDYGMEKVILSEDTDLLQLLNETTKMYRPVMDKWFDVAAVVSEQGLDPVHWRKQIIMIQSMTGTHNNVPGIKGIGFVTGRKISRKLLKGEEIKPDSVKMRAFLENQDVYLRNLQAVDLLWSLDHTPIGTSIQVEMAHVQSLNSAPYNFLDVLTAFKDLELVQAATDIRHLEGSGLQEVLPLSARS